MDSEIQLLDPEVKAAILILDTFFYYIHTRGSVPVEIGGDKSTDEENLSNPTFGRLNETLIRIKEYDEGLTKGALHVRPE